MARVGDGLYVVAGIWARERDPGRVGPIDSAAASRQSSPNKKACSTRFDPAAALEPDAVQFRLSLVMTAVTMPGAQIETGEPRATARSAAMRDAARVVLFRDALIGDPLESSQPRVQRRGFRPSRWAR